jgi:diguanylate cyclase (GGDEF)-like protein
MQPGAFARRALARAALAGLAVGVVGLAALAVGGTVTSQRSAAQLRSADQTLSAWDRALVQVSTEAEVMSDYLHTPDRLAIDVVAANLGSATPTLQLLQRRSDRANAGHVELIRDTYATFTGSLRKMVAAGRRGDHPVALAKAGEAALSAASLRKQLTVAIDFDRFRLTTALRRGDAANTRLRRATLVTVAVDLLLLTLCAVLLLWYQRRIERHARRSSHRAAHDALTGLPNRSLFEERIGPAAAGAVRTGESVAVLMLDLDGFKEVNDTLGHHGGDALLRAVADRLRGAVREADTVARLGGDEFAVLLRPVASRQQAEAQGWRLHDAVVAPVELDGRVVRVGVSVGVALSPEDGADAAVLMRHADAAMYRAKRGRLGLAACRDGPADGRRLAG